MNDMETVHLRAHTSAKGRLVLSLPPSMQNSDVDVTVTLQNRSATTQRDGSDWPVGFKERFLGAYPDAPDEPDELELREPNL